MILAYGPPGVGKTSLFCQTPSPCFIIDEQEDGIYTLQNEGLASQDIPVIPLSSEVDAEGCLGWRTLISTLENFASLTPEESTIKTLVLEAAGGLESLCFAHCGQLKFNGNMGKAKDSDGQEGFWSFYTGPKIASQEYWRKELMVVLSECVAKGYHVVLTAHSKTKPQANPRGADFEKYYPDMDDRVWGVTARRFKGIFLMLIDHTLRKSGQRVKATDSQRILIPAVADGCETKNQYGLTEDIELGDSPEEAWTALTSVLPFK